MHALAHILYALFVATCRARRVRVSEAGAQGHATLRGTATVAGQSVAASVVQTRAKTYRSSSRSPEQLENWQDRGLAVQIDHDSISAAILHAMSESIQAKVYHDELKDLCDFNSRFVGTKGNVDASHKIRDKFERMGLKTWIEDIVPNEQMKEYANATKTYGGNVIGFLEGTDLKHEVIILGAHYDSVNWEQTGGQAPGIDDNGSGSALVQLVARMLSQSTVRPRRSMMFVGFAAEEEGLVGSEQLAIKAAAGAYGDVKAVLVADEVAYPGSGSDANQAIFETVGDKDGTNALLDTFAENVLDGDGILGFKVNKHGFSSDHIPPLRLNIPAVLLIERANMEHADEYGHSARDTWEHVDMNYGAAMTRLMLRVAAVLGSPSRLTHPSPPSLVASLETRPGPVATEATPSVSAVKKSTRHIFTDVSKLPFTNMQQNMKVSTVAAMR